MELTIFPGRLVNKTNGLMNKLAWRTKVVIDDLKHTMVSFLQSILFNRLCGESGHIILIIFCNLQWVKYVIKQTHLYKGNYYYLTEYLFILDDIKYKNI